MVYDAASNTITIGKDSDFLADSGVFWVTRIRDVAMRPTAPAALKKDWQVLEGWLGCGGRDLTPADHQMITIAWKRYFAIGVAPSEKLQGVFAFMHNKYKNDPTVQQAAKPPTEVMDVFDRLLASPQDIIEKQAKDRVRERARIGTVLGSQGSWWRRQSKGFRSWVFGSAAWAVLVPIVVVIFRPFGYMDDKDVVRMIAIMLVPLVAASLKYGYDKLVR